MSTYKDGPLVKLTNEKLFTSEVTNLQIYRSLDADILKSSLTRTNTWTQTIGTDLKLIQA